MVSLFCPSGRRLPVQKRAHFGLADNESFRQGFDVVAIAREGRLQIMHIRYERRLDDRWREGLFPRAVGLFEDAGERMLDCNGVLSRSANMSRAAEGRMSMGSTVRRTLFQQPGDQAALLALNSLEFKDRGPRPGLFTRRPSQSCVSRGWPAKTDVRRLAPHHLETARARPGRSRSAGAGNPIRPLDTSDSHRPR